jgi:hypothetical protein
MNVALNDVSTYATTTIVPPLPAGGAVELAVDYAVGTCRVAFYTPETVADGFEGAPFATMELRFVAADASPKVSPDGHRLDGIPARPVPTETDSSLDLFPAVGTYEPGAIWRFV